MKEKKPISPDKALTRLRNLCDRSEYCTWELLTKMQRWGLQGDTAFKIIAKLEEERYVDDNRFAKAYAHNKALNSGWGRIKIKMGLVAKHIPSEGIKKALDEIDEKEYEDALRRVIASKKRQLGEGAESYEGRTKIFRHAASRGYETNLIARILREKK